MSIHIIQANISHQFRIMMIVQFCSHLLRIPAIDSSYEVRDKAYVKELKFRTNLLTISKGISPNFRNIPKFSLISQLKNTLEDKSKLRYAQLNPIIIKIHIIPPNKAFYRSYAFRCIFFIIVQYDDLKMNKMMKRLNLDHLPLNLKSKLILTH